MEKDIEKALTEAGLLEKFKNMPPSHQREYTKWIDEAKKPETRATRLARMVEMIRTK